MEPYTAAVVAGRSCFESCEIIACRFKRRYGFERRFAPGCAARKLSLGPPGQGRRRLGSLVEIPLGGGLTYILTLPACHRDFAGLYREFVGAGMRQRFVLDGGLRVGFYLVNLVINF
jgi:hypothetical protein